MTEAEAFVPFSPQHWWTLGAILVLCLVFPKIARGRLERPMRRLLAGVLIVHLVAKTYLWVVVVGYSWKRMLPLQICDVGYVMCAILLLRGGQRLYELVYFWGLAGTLQALLTPDLPWAFPHPAYFAYFFGHGLIIVVAVYATWGLGMRPEPMSIVRAFVAINLYALAITPVNLLLGTNFLYLMAKPEGASLMDHLGPWPWYILALEGLALVSFALYYLPFAAYDRLAAGGRLQPAAPERRRPAGPGPGG